MHCERRRMQSQIKFALLNIISWSEGKLLKYSLLQLVLLTDCCLRYLSVSTN